MKMLSIKSKLIAFLVLLAAYLSASNKDIRFLSILLVSSLAAAVIDSAINYIKQKKLIISESTVISGLIIGFVLSSGQPVWIFPLASALAISSKHFIRFNKRHLFNPAAFGILSVVILSGASTQWNGASLWYILVPFGFYFTHKIRKLEIVLSYIAVSLILFGTQAIIQKIPLWDAAKYQNWFFVFIMLIEPMTTPLAKKGKIAFGTLAAIFVFFLVTRGTPIEAELCSLLALNLLVPALNKK